MPAFRGKDKPVSGGAPVAKKMGKGERAAMRLEGAKASVFRDGEGLSAMDLGDDGWVAPKAKATTKKEAGVMTEEGLAFWRRAAEWEESQKAAAKAKVAAEAEAVKAKAAAKEAAAKADAMAELAEAEAEYKEFKETAIEAGMSWGSAAELEERAVRTINRLRAKAGVAPIRDAALERVRAMLVAPATAMPVAVPTAAAATAPVATAAEAKTYFKAMDVSRAHADHTLRIGDLPFDVQWGDLKDLFDGVGVPFANRGCVIARDRGVPILSVDPKIKLRVPARATPWDDYTKSPKGGAFVKFDSHDQAERALLKLRGAISMRCSYMGVTKRPHIDWAATDSK